MTAFRRSTIKICKVCGQEFYGCTKTTCEYCYQMLSERKKRLKKKEESEKENASNN